MERTGEWESRWWSPIINAEHLAMRESCRAVRPVRVRGAGHHRPWRAGRGAVDGRGPARRAARPGGVHLAARRQRRVPRRPDRSCGSAADQFRVVTGGATGMMDKKWITDHLPADGRAQLTDLTSAWATLRAVGPARQGHPRPVTADDVSARGLPVRHLPRDRDRRRHRAGLAHLLRRRARLGAVRADRGGRRGYGTRSGRRASRHGLIPAGIGVYGTTGRLEKGYRAYGAELDATTTWSRRA